MALKEYIGLTRLTEVFGYLKTKLDGKANTSDILISGVGELTHSVSETNPRITMNAGFKMAEGSYLSVRFKTAMSFSAYNEQFSEVIAVTIGNATYNMKSYLNRSVTINVGDIAIMVYDGTTLKIVDVSNSNSGGHSIEGADGTALSQEPTLQFSDADASDDAVNQKTVVNVVRKRTQAEYDAMSAADKVKGVIEITDADAKPLFASQVRYDSSNTVKDKLDSLSTDIANFVRIFRFALRNGVTYTLTTNYFPHLAMLTGTNGRGGIWLFGNSVCAQLWGEGENRFQMTRISATEFTVKQTSNSVATVIILSTDPDEVITIAENT